MTTLAAFFLIIMMIYGAYNHVANPEFYNGFIPDFFPADTGGFGDTKICNQICVLTTKWIPLTGQISLLSIQDFTREPITVMKLCPIKLNSHCYYFY